MNSKENIVNDTEKQIGTTSVDLLLAGAVYLLLAVYLPFAFFTNINMTVLQAISIAAAVACAFAISRISGAKKPSGAILLLIACFIFLGTVLCGLVASLLGCVCILGFLFMSAKNTSTKIFSLLPAVAAYLIAFLIVGSPVAAALALVHIPAAIALAYAFKKKLPRVSAICHISVGIILGVTAISAAWFISSHGLNLKSLVETVSAVKQSLTETLASTLFSLSGELMEISQTDAKDISTVVVGATFNLLPAIVVVLSNILAFFIQSMMTRIMIKRAQSKEDIKTMMAFEMSLVSAIIFLVAMLAAVIFAEELSVWSVTAENVMFILMPGLIFTAVGTLRAFMFAKGPSCLGTLAYIAIIGSFVYLPTVMLPLSSIAGSTIIIIHNILKAKAEKKS